MTTAHVTLSVKSINVGFTFPALTKILGQPTFYMLQTINRELTENASALETPLSPIGYAALILLLHMYLQYVPVPFLTLQKPGAVPAHAVGTTAHEIANITNNGRYHKVAYNTYTNMDRALESLLLQAVDSIYLDEI